MGRADSMNGIIQDISKMSWIPVERLQKAIDNKDDPNQQHTSVAQVVQSQVNTIQRDTKNQFSQKSYNHILEFENIPENTTIKYNITSAWGDWVFLYVIWNTRFVIGYHAYKKQYKSYTDTQEMRADIQKDIRYIQAEIWSKKIYSAKGNQSITSFNYFNNCSGVEQRGLQWIKDNWKKIIFEIYNKKHSDSP